MSMRVDTVRVDAFSLTKIGKDMSVNWLIIVFELNQLPSTNNAHV